MENIAQVIGFGLLVILLTAGLAYSNLERAERKKIIEERELYIKALGTTGFVSVDLLHARLRRSGREESLKDVSKKYQILAEEGYVLDSLEGFFKTPHFGYKSLPQGKK